MVPEIDRIKKFYKELPGKISNIRNELKRPLTLSEKILFSHLFKSSTKSSFIRGADYMDFAPDRVAMQDATAQMAILQFMMAGRKESAIPASVHCDHLVVARSGAVEDLRNSVIFNKEVYDLLRSASRKYNIDFWEPGEGIIHQIVLENYAFPGGMVIGTDSHTPTAGGLGMVAVGVGGADAVDVMAGLGWELQLPKIIGIKLTGRLSGWSSAKDVILKIAGILTVKGGTGYILEYFGEGAESISCTGKGTICNMGAETGATSSLFSYDRSMADYLIATGRKEIADLASGVKDHLSADREIFSDPEKYYNKYLEINLSEIEPYLNGPYSPDIATPISRMKEEAKKNNWPTDIKAGLIGSCTNSSYQDISRASSVVKNAISLKLVPKSEFMLNPGSEQIRYLAERDGFLDLFRKFGCEIFANACGPCIGQWDRKGTDKNSVNTVVHSFNRNFSGRVDGNPNTFAFIASPEIVTALAISGKLTFNPLTDNLKNSAGETVKLDEPSGLELPPSGYGNIERITGITEDSNKDAEIIINPGSKRLQILKPFTKWDGKDLINLPLLIKVKGKCTTDHISMAGEWLKFRGHLENISDNYMIGAVNYFNDKANNILNQISGKYEPVPLVAKAYKERGTGSVVIGEENFGEGSSREHAAMEPRYLGVKAVLVKSFARIHETNLKKQGVLAITFTDKDDYNKVKEDDKISITGLGDFTPGRLLTLELNHSDGRKDSVKVEHSYNEAQIKWFRAGSALNLISSESKK
jgi:aconitate hydratase